MADGDQGPAQLRHRSRPGKWLVCGNLAANAVTVYRVDVQSGRLSFVGSVAVPEPLCVRFLQI
jgi:6-phosphogluconolactonase (cycloisomerase 2 family)